MFLAFFRFSYDLMGNDTHAKETSAQKEGMEEEEEAINAPPLLPLGMGSRVTLLPGDSLYIPPYWLARVQADSLSLALTVHSPTAVDRMLAEVRGRRRRRNVCCVVLLYELCELCVTSLFSTIDN